MICLGYRISKPVAYSKIKLKSADEISEFAENLINTVRKPLLLLDKNLRVIKAGCESYLAKPFTKESLFNMIARYTRK